MKSETNTPPQADLRADVRLVTVREVADLLGVHVRSVWRLAQSGEIPAPIRLSARVIRWRLSDLRAFLDARSEVADADGRSQAPREVCP